MRRRRFGLVAEEDGQDLGLGGEYAAEADEEAWGPELCQGRGGGDTRWEQGIWSVRGREESGNPRRSDEDKKQVNRVKERQVAGEEGKRRTIGR